MELTARLFFFTFGALTIAGGVVGFLKARSKASLIAGTLLGVLLVGSAALIGTSSSRAGLAIALALSALLGARFVPAYAKTRKAMPAGMMAALSCIGIVVTVATLLSR